MSFDNASSVHSTHRQLTFYQHSRECNNAKRRLTGLEQEDRNLSEVKIDEMLGFMCDVASKVTSDNAVKRWAVLLVELLFDICEKRSNHV
jgi:hypothetical protein